MVCNNSAPYSHTGLKDRKMPKLLICHFPWFIVILEDILKRFEKTFVHFSTKRESARRDLRMFSENAANKGTSDREMQKIFLFFVKKVYINYCILFGSVV